MAAVWIVLVVGLGALAPRVETALSGAGWEDSGSESVRVREDVQRAFAGNASSALTVVVASDSPHGGRPGLRADGLAGRGAPGPGRRDRLGDPAERRGRHAERRRAHRHRGRGRRDDPTGMVRAADDLKGELADAAAPGMTVSVTGASGMWSDFNRANKDAMLTSELISWPVTLAILVVAFGALVAAGLPLLLTILGLVASAGSLVVAAQLFDVSIWAMNFALMFALALGIDYALFIVVRFRGALWPIGGSREPRRSPSPWTPPARRSSSPGSRC